MTTTPTSAGSTGLVDRVKNILLTPKAEWERIAAEPADVNKLYIGYALPLIALSAICSFIGMSFIGVPLLGRLPIALALAQIISNAIVQLVCLFIAAFIANALAPSFGSKQDMGQAQKLIVYGSTAGMLAGVFGIFPPLAVLGLIAALYSIVLMYMGMTPVMGTPADKRVGYVAVLIIIYIVVVLVLSYVVGMILLMTGLSAAGAALNAISMPK
jgi:small-conductance mechanosensitive channel